MSSMNRLIRRTSRVALVAVMLVVLAGSVVRMTGSGMGCPDWPKCFGYLIPPTDEEKVSWSAQREFKSGQMIVRNDELLVAQSDFISGDDFNPLNWKTYDQHDYAVFNVAHTWTEYINRLLGAFSGVPVLLLFVLCLTQFKRDVLLSILATAALFMLGFVAWLGKTVVDSNLLENQITLHMAGALSIVGLLVMVLRRAETRKPSPLSPELKWTLLALLVLGLVQIFLGTQVREEVDALYKAGVERSDWIARLPEIFPIHRSFAWLILILTALALWQGRRMKPMSATLKALGVLVLLEWLAGVTLAYAGMPALLQPFHLIAAFLMFALALYALLPNFSPAKS